MRVYYLHGTGGCCGLLDVVSHACMQALIAILNAKGPENLRPKRYCCCVVFMYMVKLVTFILFICVWILAAVLIG